MAKKTKNLRDDLKGMKKPELEKELANLKEEVRVIKFKSEGGRGKNVKEVTALKKQVARVLTELNRNNKK